VALITGSNMSGKSTFLRTLGVNLALAYAGGPVNAGSLRLLPFRVFTCINVSDSLSDGISTYAEVRRLKALLTSWKKRKHRPCSS
jgi:DNA mismatch repair ATPase MutS